MNVPTIRACVPRNAMRRVSHAIQAKHHPLDNRGGYAFLTCNVIFRIIKTRAGFRRANAENALAFRRRLRVYA